MKLNVFKVYSRAVHSYLLVLEAVTTESASVVGCNTLHCDPPPDLTYAVTLSGLAGDAGVFASNVIDTPISPVAHNIELEIAVGGSTVLTVRNDTGITYTATPTLSGDAHTMGCVDPDTGVFASAAIHTPDTPLAHSITLIVAVGGSTVLTVRNDTGVAYTATPTLSGVTHDLGLLGASTTTEYFAALAYLLNQLDDVSAVADGATNVTITADVKAVSTYDITVTGTAVVGGHFATTEVAGAALEPPSTTKYFAALAYLLNQLDNVSAVADGATSVTITADEKATSAHDIIVTGTAVVGGHFETTATAGLASVNIWEAWNGTHVLTWRDTPGHLIGFPGVTGTNRNCNWYDSEKKIHLYPAGLSEWAQPWVVTLSATPEHKLTWGSPLASFCDIVGDYAESGASFCAPALSAACVSQGSGATTCVVTRHLNAAAYKEEDTNIFVCFDDPQITASSSSSDSSESGLIALYTQCSDSSSSASSAPEAALYQIFPNRMLVSIASLSDLDIIPIDVPDDRLYRTSTVALLFHSLSQLEAVLASVISDAQVIARFQNYDIQVTETITSEGPVHDMDPGDLYNIP